MSSDNTNEIDISIDIRSLVSDSSSITSADSNICKICYENELSSSLVCKTCNKKMACRSCFTKIVHSQSEEGKCPYCRGENTSLLREEGIIINRRFSKIKTCLETIVPGVFGLGGCAFVFLLFTRVFNYKGYAEENSNETGMI